MHSIEHNRGGGPRLSALVRLRGLNVRWALPVCQLLCFLQKAKSTRTTSFRKWRNWEFISEQSPQSWLSSPKPLISSQVASSSLQPCPPHGPHSCLQQVQMLKIKRLLNLTLRFELRSRYTVFQSLKCLFI